MRACVCAHGSACDPLPWCPVLHHLTLGLWGDVHTAVRSVVLHQSPADTPSLPPPSHRHPADSEHTLSTTTNTQKLQPFLHLRALWVCLFWCLLCFSVAGACGINGCPNSRDYLTDSRSWKLWGIFSTICCSTKAHCRTKSLMLPEFSSKHRLIPQMTVTLYLIWEVCSQEACVRRCPQFCTNPNALCCYVTSS